MICEKTKRKINQNRVNFDFDAFFASFFRFANLGNFLNTLQFYASGSACFFIFRGKCISEKSIKIKVISDFD